MNKHQRIVEAAQWFFLCRDETRFDGVQKHAFERWLRDPENMAEYLRFAEWVASVEGSERPQCTETALTADIVPLFDHVGRKLPPGLLTATPAAARKRISRRVVIATAAGLSGACITGALTSVVSPGRPDVTRTGHVLKVKLPAGVMHAARHSTFRIDQVAQTVHVVGGQVAFDLFAGVRTITRVVTPFGEFAVGAARFGVLVRKSMAVVTVAKGKVHVVASDVPTPHSVLIAGQKRILQRGVVHAPMTVVDAEQELAWTDGVLYFTDETFGEAAATFNRFNDLQIRPSASVARRLVGSHHCSLSDPQRFVDRYVDVWELASVREGNLIHILERNEAQVPR